MMFRVDLRQIIQTDGVTGHRLCLFRFSGHRNLFLRFLNFLSRRFRRFFHRFLGRLFCRLFQQFLQHFGGSLFRHGIFRVTKFLQNIFQIQIGKFQFFFVHIVPSSGLLVKLIPVSGALPHTAGWMRRQRRSGRRSDPSWEYGPAYRSSCEPGGSCRRLRCR